MAKICDNTNVGQVIRRKDDGAFLMIERFNYPESYAFVAGHGDGLALSAAAEKETMEEAGLTILENKLVWKGTIDNPCKRQNGDHHVWEIFEAVEWSGEPKAGDDAKAFFWALPGRLRQLADRTEYFMRKYNTPYNQVGDLVKAIFGDLVNKNTDVEWRGDMGLEPVWYFILKEIGIL